jgi:hypothetical protein
LSPRADSHSFVELSSDAERVRSILDTVDPD